MKNSEKVKELARKYRGTMTDAQYHSMFNAIEEMAEWKDAQFKEFLFGVTLHSNAVIVARMIQDKIKELEK